MIKNYFQTMNIKVSVETIEGTMDTVRRVG